MKIEYKEITIQRPVFIADDGTEFVDEDECGKYELDLLEKTLDCYDEKYNKTDVESCQFVDLKTKKDVKTFMQVCDYYGIVTDGIKNPGLYMFDDTYRDTSWVNLDDVIFHIRGGIKDEQR